MVVEKQNPKHIRVEIGFYRFNEGYYQINGVFEWNYITVEAFEGAYFVWLPSDQDEVQFDNKIDFIYYIRTHFYSLLAGQLLNAMKGTEGQLRNLLSIQERAFRLKEVGK